MKKTILITVLLCSINIFGQEENKTSQNNEIISNFMRLSSQQLYDTADYYFNQNSYDTALICYHLLLNAIPPGADFEQRKFLPDAYNRLANIYFLISNYRMAYDFLIRRLLICEKYDLIPIKAATYANIGVVYDDLNQYEISKQYYLKALHLYEDSADIVILLNNLGNNEIKRGFMDSAYYSLNKSIEISKRHNNVYLHYMFNSLASYYQIINQYDSAFYYFRLSLDVSKENNDIIVETVNLSDIGKLYFALNKTDSALYYIGLSNKIAIENKFLRHLSNNYFILSEIEKSKGRYKDALNHYVTYTNLKDSIHNADVFSGVNLIQRQYEISKTNQQIEELFIDQQLKENKIRYQRIMWLITSVVLLLVTLVLAVIISQKRKLNKAYKLLFEKNIEIVELLDNISEINTEKIKKRTRPENKHSELLNKILIVMEDASVFCDTEFTIDKLADLVQSNQKYVSEAINYVLNKNFRSFLNGYRIREAQQLLSKQGFVKYTIESVAPLVGYKSPMTFRKAFQEITGVSPSYYIKSILDQLKTEK